MHRIFIADDTEGEKERNWIALYEAFPDVWLSPWKYKLIKIEEGEDQFLELQDKDRGAVSKFGTGDWEERENPAFLEEISLDDFIIIAEGAGGEIEYSGRKHLEDNHSVCPHSKISRTGDGVVTVQANSKSSNSKSSNSKSFICIHKTRLVAL
jgi:hypothetical protein